MSCQDNRDGKPSDKPPFHNGPTGSRQPAIRRNANRFEERRKILTAKFNTDIHSTGSPQRK